MEDILSRLTMINRDVEMIRKVVERINDSMRLGTQPKKVQVSGCSGHSSSSFRTEQTELEKDQSDISLTLPGLGTVVRCSMTESLSRICLLSQERGGPRELLLQHQLGRDHLPGCGKKEV